MSGRGNGDSRAETLTRRRALGLAAGVAAAAATGDRWLWALSPRGEIVKAAATAGASWKPRLLSLQQAEGLARLCDAIIPPTDTPGARGARVHEYIDLAVSLEDRKERDDFLKGLRWFEKRCRKTQDVELERASPEQITAVLAEVSDDHDTHRRRLRRGAEFFAELKQRTIFGYYTSETGRVEELGLPEKVKVARWQGCEHESGHPTAG